MISFVCFSGGLDSTYALWRELKDTANDVVVMRIAFKEAAREEKEKAAAENILRWMAKNMRPITCCYIPEFSMNFPHHRFNDFYPIIMFTGLVLMSHPVAGTLNVKIVTGITADSFGGEDSGPRFHRLIKAQLAEADYIFVTVGDDYYDVPARQRIAEMPTELYSLTWSCRSPSKSGEPCEECPACNRIDGARE